MGSINSKNIAEQPVGLKDFKMLKSIGKGGFGKVRVVEYQKNKNLYALKYINKIKCIKMNALEYIIRERDLLEEIEHPYVVNLRFSFQNRTTMFMVIDLMLGGDLRFHIDRKRFDERVVRHWIAEIACGLSYLHEIGIIHRDIKPDNILMDNKGHVALTDFNVAAKVQPNKLNYTKAGTVGYMAPEIISGTGYTKSVDWWSLGVVMYECIYNERPFNGESPQEICSETLYKNVSYPTWKGVRISNECIDAMSGFLERDPAKRLGSGEDVLSELRSTEFFCIMDWNLIIKKLARPPFIPDSDISNFDIMHELEEVLNEDENNENFNSRKNMGPEIQNSLKQIDKEFLTFDYNEYEKFRGFVEERSLNPAADMTLAAPKRLGAWKRIETDTLVTTAQRPGPSNNTKRKMSTFSFSDRLNGNKIPSILKPKKSVKSIQTEKKSEKPGNKLKTPENRLSIGPTATVASNNNLANKEPATRSSGLISEAMNLQNSAEDKGKIIHSKSKSDVINDLSIQTQKMLYIKPQELNESKSVNSDYLKSSGEKSESPDVNICSENLKKKLSLEHIEWNSLPKEEKILASRYSKKFENSLFINQQRASSDFEELKKTLKGEFGFIPKNKSTTNGNHINAENNISESLNMFPNAPESLNFSGEPPQQTEQHDFNHSKILNGINSAVSGTEKSIGFTDGGPSSFENHSLVHRISQEHVLDSIRDKVLSGENMRKHTEEVDTTVAKYSSIQNSLKKKQGMTSYIHNVPKVSVSGFNRSSEEIDSAKDNMDFDTKTISENGEFAETEIGKNLAKNNMVSCISLPGNISTTPSPTSSILPLLPATPNNRFSFEMLDLDNSSESINSTEQKSTKIQSRKNSGDYNYKKYKDKSGPIPGKPGISNVNGGENDTTGTNRSKLSSRLSSFSNRLSFMGIGRKPKLKRKDLKHFLGIDYEVSRPISTISTTSSYDTGQLLLEDLR
ncbi:hypothetical protein BB559_000761 [Furculomyces boomerangus]|uniref:Protein kinase domain-containing protein n=2 Tax=Harpellales TaxID=61421 RepID=A0A2T9Z428_9FUNG|nr:hypothetical protein BB559_000761 [Furculomyces boomerangus]PWA03246.1 hypothetical protein BB558_000574 [Smittium angustum]